jgi:hypothetical protein
MLQLNKDHMTVCVRTTMSDLYADLPPGEKCAGTTVVLH